MIGPQPADTATTPNEEQRLSALERYLVLDTPREVAFDRLTRLTTRFLRAPSGFISFIDRDRQCFKSCFGWDERETPREMSFCTHAVAADDVFVVPDATDDPRFRDNPLVTGAAHVRAYAGAPLKTQDGFVLGTLAVIDTKPRRFSDVEIETLTELAAVVVDELELRLSLLMEREAEEQIATALGQVREANAARENFLSSVSHELRTPLNAILGFAQLLETEDLTPDHKRDVGEIITAAKSLLRMINQMFAAVPSDEPN